ncbi:MAG TPA: response regulator [Candidatus Saccharimonadales bacterium]|nr:response regulator [Candidatus Saccharimonadales bacterium]
MSSPHNSRNLRILVIDDNRSIHDDFRKILCGGSTKSDSLTEAEAILFDAAPPVSNRLAFEVHSAYHGQEGLTLVKEAIQNGRPYAMAFVDVRMPPGWDGVETAAHIWEVCPDLQIVLCSAYSDYSWNQMADRLRNAHQLVILKKPFDSIEVLQLADALTEKWQLHQQVKMKVDQLENLVQQRTTVLRETNQRLEREVIERKRSEARIQEQAMLLNMAQDAIYVRDLAGGISFWNTGAERLYGWSAQEAVGADVGRLFPEVKQKAFAEAERSLLEKGEWRGEVCQKSKDGQEVITDSRWTLLRDGARSPCSVLVINTDQTEKKKLEAQFLRAQRMESIGTLASGMAHDLNNILAPILMSASMLRWSLPVKEQEVTITRIETSVRRAAEIIQQVLTFGRGVNGERVPVNLAELMEEIGKIIGQTFPKNITIVLDEAPKLWPIIGDKTQIHQVLLNLCINARDAMPAGGILSLRAQNLRVGEECAALNVPAKAGPYVLLQVTDTGCGIAPSNRDRVFDPFFTTKDIGKGTGLGLSTVLGIVKSHHGFVNIDSELKKGASFRVYLPASTESATTITVAPSHVLPRGEGETILLVDDEKDILLATGKMLEQSGYKVVAASSGDEALDLFRQQEEAVDLVLTDIMMAGMDGMALIHALREIDPAVRIIASTGLGVKLRPVDLQLLPANSLLSKPYSAETLLTSLDRALKGTPKRTRYGLVSAMV